MRDYLKLAFEVVLYLLFVGTAWDLVVWIVKGGLQ